MEIGGFMKKLIVVTGATSGIGLAAARRLSSDGHKVVAVGRTASEIQALPPELQADFLFADFTSLDDVVALAERIRDRYDRIDVLANNAGIDASKERQATQDGYERTLQVNYLAPFLLTFQLLDRLVASKATVIFTSSLGHKVWGDLDIDDVQLEREYSAKRAYGNTKLALILLARELQRRYRREGLASASFHPGVIRTNLSNEPGSGMHWVYHTPLKYVMKSPEKGADTLVFLAEGTPGADFPSGEYLVKRKVEKPKEQALDADLAKQLWLYSEDVARRFSHGTSGV